METASDTSDRLAALGQRLDALHRRPHELLDAGETAGALRLADLKDLLLRFIEQLCRLRAPLECLPDDRGGYLDQAPKQRLLAHDARVELDVCRRWDGVH